MRPDRALPVGRAFDLAGTVLKDDHADRPLTDGVAGPQKLLDSSARLS
jgi:histidine ammonia-lyase